MILTAHIRPSSGRWRWLGSKQTIRFLNTLASAPSDSDHLIHIKMHIHNYHDNHNDSDEDDDDDEVLSHSDINIAGQVIGQSTTLTKITISAEYYIPQQDSDNEDVSRLRGELQQLLSRGINQNRSVRTLTLFDCSNLCGVVVEMFANFIETNPSLERIFINATTTTTTTSATTTNRLEEPYNFANTMQMTSNQLELLGRAIANRQIAARLEELSLGGMGIDDEGMSALLSAFDDAPDRTPNSLILGNNNIGSNCCRLLSQLLRDRTCSLSNLQLGNNQQIHDEMAISFAKALKGNTVLRKLGLKNTSISIIGWNAFLPLLMNMNSIQDTYQSNHTLETLGNFLGNHSNNTNPLPRKLQQLLEMNSNPNKKCVACRKVLIYEFWDDARMEVLSPFVIVHFPIFLDKAIASGAASVENRDKLCLVFFFNALRHDPFLCLKDVPKQQSQGGGVKR